MVSAGWYQDPSDPQRQRYWDGGQWTDQVQGPPSAGFAEQPPVSYGQQNPTVVGSYGGFADQGPTNPIGPGFSEWINATFSGFIKGVLPTTGLIFLYTMPFYLVLLVFGYSVLDGLVIREDVFGDLSVDGFDGFASLYAAGALLVITGLLQYAGVIGSHHYMYTTHMGENRSFLGSFFAGLKALPKYLLFGLGILLLMALLMAPLIAIGAVADGGAVIFLLVAVGIVVFFVLIYIAIRLVYVPLTAATAPAGEGFIRASWNASRGRFWPIVGRLILIWFIAAFIGFIFNIISNIVLNAALPFEFSDTGELLVDGATPSIADGIRITDYLPSIGLMGAFLAVSTLGQAVQYGLFASNNAAMYIQDQEASKLTAG